MGYKNVKLHADLIIGGFSDARGMEMGDLARRIQVHPLSFTPFSLSTIFVQCTNQHFHLVVSTTSKAFESIGSSAIWLCLHTDIISK